MAKPRTPKKTEPRCVVEMVHVGIKPSRLRKMWYRILASRPGRRVLWRFQRPLIEGVVGTDYTVRCQFSFDGKLPMNRGIWSYSIREGLHTYSCMSDGSVRIDGRLTEAFDGVIDEVRIWNRVLPPEKVLELYEKSQR